MGPGRLLRRAMLWRVMLGARPCDVPGGLCEPPWLQIRGRGSRGAVSLCLGQDVKDMCGGGKGCMSGVARTSSGVESAAV